MPQKTRILILIYTALLLGILNVRGLGMNPLPKIALTSQAENLTNQSSPNSTGNGNTYDFVGKIESIHGNLWMVGGQVFAVSPQAVGPATFHAGQTVHIEGTLASSGLVKVARVEAPSLLAAITAMPAKKMKVGLFPGMSSANTNGSYDGQELYGTVEAINGDQITIDGVTYTLMFYDDDDDYYVSVGDMVEFEYMTNTDGTLIITDIESTSSMGEDRSKSSYKEHSDDDHSYNNGNGSYYDDDDEDGDSDWDD